MLTKQEQRSEKQPKRPTMFKSVVKVLVDIIIGFFYLMLGLFTFGEA